MTWNWKSAFDWRTPGPTKERLVIGGAGLLVILAIAGMQNNAAPPLPVQSRQDGAQTIADSPPTTAPPVQETPTPAAAAWHGPQRPALESHQGRAFAYSAPVGWHVTETSNGVDIAAPDGITGVAASILVGGFGHPTPRQYLMQILQTTGQANARFLSVRAIPPRPGPMGLQWRGIQAEIESAQRGQPIHIQATSQVLQGAGQYAAIATGAQGPIAQWDDLRTWLPHVRDSIRITNGAIVTGNMANALPRGIDDDAIYGDYNRAWEARQIPEDQLSEARREATMGYSRQMDPNTGKIWDMPLEAYDPTVQGYRNPRHPHELLTPACQLGAPTCN